MDYNKEEFQNYLMTKVAESTAKTYATDMAVSVKALANIALYENKTLVEALEDFVSHKKHMKNYLQDEFLKALVDAGSNDSGLYDSLLSKAKHYVSMSLNKDENNNSNTSDSSLENIIEKLQVIVTKCEQDNYNWSVKIDELLWEAVGEYVEDEPVGDYDDLYTYMTDEICLCTGCLNVLLTAHELKDDEKIAILKTFAQKITDSLDVDFMSVFEEN